MVNRAKFLALLFNLIILCDCREKIKVEENKISHESLVKKTVFVINEKMFEQSLVGLEPEQHTLIIKKIPESQGFHDIALVDIETLNVIKNIKIRSGNEQAPSEVARLDFIERVGSHYFVIDGFAKIAVFDENFNWVSSFRFSKRRVFLDFFESGPKNFFYLGTYKWKSREAEYSLKVFQLELNQKQELPREILDFGKGEIQLPFISGPWREGAIWARLYGFEKKGTFYYSDNQEPVIHRVNRSGKEDQAIRMKYLRKKKFTVNEVEKFDWKDALKSYIKSQKRNQIKHVSYPSPLYHFGIYDVGDGLCGIVSEIDIDNSRFQVDVIDLNQPAYLYSLWLPVDWGFKLEIKATGKGLLPLYINVDSGFFAYTGLNEEGDMVAKIMKFKLQ